MKFINLIMLFLICSILYTQVNTESMRSDNKQTGMKNKISLNFTYFSGKTTIFHAIGKYRLDFNSSSGWNSFIIGKYNRAVEKDNEDFAKQTFVHLRIAKLIRKKLSIESFAQKEANNFINLIDREVIGLGLRLNQFNNFYLGMGIMNEIEKYNDSLKENVYVKSTNYINHVFTISDNAKIQNVLYYQVSIENMKSFRVLWQSELNINITESFLLDLNINYRFDSNLNSYFDISNGIIFEF